ncbi:hypothetical protein BV898_16704 [Hypsibius exemplaris]|uniref:WKF domain-containing protein n=1 Tax=Hypsibius exemplaris TaxID=2072580 RepID=A0A9X6NGD1_HYPEX|nr:hypothetical protein BV898_16704 [Hypsibius exemplaris]
MDFLTGAHVEEASATRKKKHSKRKNEPADSFRPETFTASVSDIIQDEAVISSGADATVTEGEERMHRKRKSKQEKANERVAADEEDQEDAQFASQLIDAALPAEMLVEPVEGEEPEKKKRKKRTRAPRDGDVPTDGDLPTAAEEDGLADEPPVEVAEPAVKSKKKKRTKMEDEEGGASGSTKPVKNEPASERASSPAVLDRQGGKVDQMDTGVPGDESSGIKKGILKGVNVKKAKPLASSKPAMKPTGNTYVDPAITYLRVWKSARSAWSFQKVRQVWLLRNWRDRLKMNDDDFLILIDYLADLKGGSRVKTIDEAKAIREEYENSETYGADDELKKKLYERAGRIVSALSPVEASEDV